MSGRDGPATSLPRSLAHALSANFLVLLANTAMFFGLPFLISETDYGLWQLYQFFTIYLGYVTFGVTDGIVLRLSGKSESSLDKPSLAGQFWCLVAGVTAANIAIGWVLVITTNSPDRIWVVIASCIGGLLYVPKTMVTAVFQAVSRMDRYGWVTGSERVFICFATFGLVAIGVTDFHWLILMDVLGKLVSLVLGCIIDPRLVFSRFPLRRALFQELWANGMSGSQILLANLSLLLMPGVVRLIVLHYWDVTVFGKLSLAFNVSSALLGVIASMSMALFPALKRVPAEQHTSLYVAARAGLMPLLWVSAIAYYPISFVMGGLLPSYSEGLVYLAFLFPVFVFDAKMRLLVTNYLKSMRMERKLMSINLGAVILAAGWALVAGVGMHNLTLVVLAVPLASILRVGVAEWVLARVLGIRVGLRLVVDILMGTVFICCAWFLSPIWGLAFYTVATLGYLLIFRADIATTWRRVVHLFRKRHHKRPVIDDQLPGQEPTAR